MIVDDETRRVLVDAGLSPIDVDWLNPDTAILVRYRIEDAVDHARTMELYAIIAVVIAFVMMMIAVVAVTF